MSYLDKYPKELTVGREKIEASVVFCMWKETDHFLDYGREINPEKDLLDEDARFYFGLGKQMVDLGYKSLDDASIYSYLDGKEVLSNGFNRRGGYKTVDQLKSILHIENMESYYDEMVKSNMLMKLHDKGFNVLADIAKFKKMTSSQLYDYFEFQLDNVFLNRGSGVKIEDLDIDQELIDSANSGEDMGLSYGKLSPLLNFHTMGLHKSNVQIFAGFSGSGKSSKVMHTYVMSILDAGEKVSIIANEMNKKAWQHLFLATILSQKLGYYGIPRKKQKMGNFNDEQKEMLQKAVDYYNEHYKGQIKFIKIYDYSVEDVKRVIRKLKKQGFDWAIYDTFKAENAASDKVTGELIEASKQLLQVAEKEEVGIIITMQLAIYMENTRFLTAQTLSNAKGVKEVVSELVLTRKLWDDEFHGEKFDVKPYRFKKDPSTNKYTRIKEEIVIHPEPDTRYMIMFLDKTRNDEDGICLLYKFKGAWNSWKEVGYCTPKHVRS